MMKLLFAALHLGLRLIRPVISETSLTVDIGGFGIMPQMFLATDGPLSPPEGEILISSRLSLLNSSQEVLINGLIHGLMGNQKPTYYKLKVI